jgi:hypothetical protein
VVETSINYDHATCMRHRRRVVVVKNRICSLVQVVVFVSVDVRGWVGAS